MKISIITITYNAEKTLPATLKSVAEQSFSDYEHLIIDGASTDATVALARECGNPRVQVFSEPDKGLYDAMNKGLHRAQGEYVLFLNAGDAFHHPGVLASFAALTGPDTDIVYGDTYLVDETRKVVGKRHYSAPERLSFESFAKGMLVCHQAFLMRRDKAPDYDLKYRFSADYDWTVKCLKQTSSERCRNLREYVIDYLTEGLTDKNHTASLKERFRVMAHHYGLPKTLCRHVAIVIRTILRKYGVLGR